MKWKSVNFTTTYTVGGSHYVFNVSLTLSDSYRTSCSIPESIFIRYINQDKTVFQPRQMEFVHICIINWFLKTIVR